MMQGGANTRAQIALPYVLLISGIIIEIVIAGAIVAYFVWNTTQEEELQTRAEGAAYSGMQDAMKRIGENKEWGGVAYCLLVGSDGVDVVTTRTVDAVANAYIYAISSLGAARGARAELSAVAVVDKNTGKVFLQNAQSVPVSRSYTC